MAKVKQGKCPECGRWSEVVCENYVAPSFDMDALGERGEEVIVPVHVWGWWWADTRNGGGCPGCGALVLVESECDFREFATPQGEPCVELSFC